MLLKLIFLLQLCNVFADNFSVIRSCPAGTFSFKSDNKRCYMFFNELTAFKMAEDHCVQQGGHLAQINDLPLNKLLSVKARKELEYDVKFWIGGQSTRIQDNNYNNIWTWTDHSLITYFNWNQSQPSGSSYGEQKCISATFVGGTWSAENCAEEMPYLCEIRSAISVCEPGWTLNDKSYKCFKAFTRKLINQNESEAQCQAQDGHLASIHSEEENDFLCNLTAISYTGNWDIVGVWIGAVSDSAKNWSWTDKSAYTYNKFGEDDPENKPSLCAMLYPDGMSSSGHGGYIKKWDSSDCNLKTNRFVCQKDPIFLTS